MQASFIKPLMAQQQRQVSSLSCAGDGRNWILAVTMPSERTFNLIQMTLIMRQRLQTSPNLSNNQNNGDNDNSRKLKMI
jgi:hypothetical protein